MVRYLFHLIVFIFVRLVVKNHLTWFFYFVGVSRRGRNEFVDDEVECSDDDDDDEQDGKIYILTP